MVASTGPKFSMSVRDEMLKASAEVSQVQLLLANRNNSHWVVNEHLCTAANRLSRVHGLITEYGRDFDVAREAKGAALNRLGEQEQQYAGACRELDDFLRWFDEVTSQVGNADATLEVHVKPNVNFQTLNAAPCLACSFRQTDKWKVHRESHRLVVVRDAFETAEAMTQSARGNVEVPIERWIEDSVTAHADAAGGMLSKAERWTATAVATLKREQLGIEKGGGTRPTQVRTATSAEIKGGNTTGKRSAE